MTISRRRRAAWLALCAVLLNALMPALMQAAASPSAGSGSLLAICTAAGLRHLPIGVDAVESTQSDDGTGQHSIPPGHAEHGDGQCPYCTGHAGAFALLTVDRAIDFSIGEGPGSDSVLLPPPPLSPRGLVAAPRGPPSVLT